MHILICNDDGIHAPGLAALEAAAYTVADRTSVVAPIQEHSAQSHALTVRHPIFVNHIPHPSNCVRAAVEGTPADCVRLGILELCKEPIDLVISGINPGANMGWEIFVSGTVAIASEAFSFGIPAVAFSLATWNNHRFATGQKAAEILLPYFVKLAGQHRKGDPAFLYNVNIPNIPFEEIKGVRMTTVEPNIKGDAYESREAPDGRTYYWATWGDRNARSQQLTDPHFDCVAVREGFISVSRLLYEVGSMPDNEAERAAFESIKLG